MIEKLAIAQRTVAEDILKLQQLAYRIEADLIGFADLPPLKESAEDVQNSAEDFYGYFARGQLCAVISVQRANEVMEICRLCVHPAQFRKGIAQQMLQYVEQHVNGYEEIRVSTGTGNHPAVQFYKKNGFSELRRVQTLEGLFITLFNKRRIITCDKIRLDNYRIR